MRLRLVPLAALAVLAACGTPQEQCINRNTRDLRTVDRLIAESERNLSRGYAIEYSTEWRPVWVPCYGPPVRPGGKPVSRMCWDERPETVSRPRAIDLNAESLKLQSLKQRRATLSRQAESVVRQCRALYPEEGK
ncbi:MAG: hypothetical protein QM656_15580 [Paracoccaceae bacterium]